MHNGTKYTPGPWSVDVHQNIMCEGKLVAFPGLSDGLPQEANAQLIAAAPDMFEALNGLTLLIATLRDCQLGGSEVAAWIIEKPVYAQAISALRKAGL